MRKVVCCACALASLAVIAACRSHAPAPVAAAPPVPGDLDGDRVTDDIATAHSGGAHCCTALTVTLSSCAQRIALPFRIDHGLYELVDPDGDGVSSLLVTTHTYNAERFPLEPELSARWGIHANDVLAHFAGCRVTMEDLPHHVAGAAHYLARYRDLPPIATTFRGADGRWGYRSAAGTEVLPPMFEAAGPVVDGRAVVQVGSDELTIIDTRGVIVRQLEGIAVVDDAPAFRDGRLLAMRGATLGYLDTDGEWIIEPTYDDARSFRHGIAAVERRGKWGYIDRAGRWVFPPRFDAAFDFEDGRAEVSFRGVPHVLDRASGQLSTAAR